ncbi:MAG: hypothetical protein RL260_2716 [Pseudomonadota bacterium]|jgi:hypothetical protein
MAKAPPFAAKSAPAKKTAPAKGMPPAFAKKKGK